MPGTGTGTGLSGAAKDATDSLMGTPNEVMKAWPYIIGFGILDWLADKGADMLDDRQSPSWAKSLFTGLVDTSKFSYWDGPTPDS